MIKLLSMDTGMSYIELGLSSSFCTLLTVFSSYFFFQCIEDCTKFFRHYVLMIISCRKIITDSIYTPNNYACWSLPICLHLILFDAEKTVCPVPSSPSILLDTSKAWTSTVIAKLSFAITRTSL